MTRFVLHGTTEDTILDVQLYDGRPIEMDMDDWLETFLMDMGERGASLDSVMATLDSIGFYAEVDSDAVENRIEWKGEL